MKSSAPWSVKGIERDARETAKEAAKREGMTVGEWLNQIIYSAGGASDGQIEGLQLRDIVTAIEHLNNKLGEVDGRNKETLAELSRSIAGAVERIQRLERVKPGEAGGERQRIEALKALEKAVAHVATQFDTTQKSTLERVEANERQLQELAARIDAVSPLAQSGDSAALLKDALGGLTERLERAEAIAEQAAALNAQAGGSADPGFVERTGERMRVLGDEIKRGGDQIRDLEAAIAKLADQIDAAERRSAEGVQKVADRVAELSHQIGAAPSAETPQDDNEPSGAPETLAPQSFVDDDEEDVLADIDPLGDIGGDDIDPVAGMTGGEDDEEPGEEYPIHDEIGAQTSASLLDPEGVFSMGDDEEDDDGADPFAFEDDIDESGPDLSFELDHEEEDDRGEEDDDELGAGSPAYGALGATKGGATGGLEKADSDDGDIAGAAPSNEDDHAAAADRERAEAKALLFGDQPSIKKSLDALEANPPQQDATPEQSDQDDEQTNAPQAGEAGGRRRQLTPKQRAILAARARQKKRADALKTMGAKKAQQAPQKTAQKQGRDEEDKTSPRTEPAEAPPSAPAPSAQARENDEDEAQGGPFGRLYKKIPGLGGRDKSEHDDDENEFSAHSKDANSEENADGVRAALSTMKTTAAARPVTLAMGVAICLAGAALFFLVKDILFKPAAPGPRPSVTLESADIDATDAQIAPPSASDMIEPRRLYQIAMETLSNDPQGEGAAAALEELQQAAALGYPPAQLQLGEFYKTGQGVEQDLAQARNWFRRAANGGNLLAMHRIGVMTARGDGGPADTNEAIGWFEQAANRGLLDSQYNLGAIFHPSAGSDPDGVQDAAKAYYWYALAAKNGDEQAAPLAAAIAATLPPAQIGALDEDVASWTALPVDEGANERLN